MIKQQLRPYQAEVGRAVLESVLGRRGLTFSMEMARQAGKNELSAQLELLLLTLFMDQSVNGVKCSPTFRPQALISIRRLKDRLTDAGYGGFFRTEQGFVVRLGRAREIFLSAEPSANVVGQTAHFLLEVDEAQDVPQDKFYKDFRPMASSTNATTVLYGTAWDDATLLEEVKQQNLALERKDGIQRHFRYDWQEVAKYNPAYLAFVEGERQRLGEDHPLFKTQYCLEPLGEGGRLFSAQQRAQLLGDHLRRSQPAPNAVCVAGIDIGGEAPDLERSARRDSTVITIGELDFTFGNEWLKTPKVRIVEHCHWTGLAHADLIPRLADILRNVWRCRRVVVDATGLGEAVAGLLRAALGSSIVPFTFTAPSKSHLGFQLLAAVNRGQVKMYRDGGDAAGEFWHQMERAKVAYRPNQTMNFFVAERDGHDDFLMSLALLVEATFSYAPRTAKGKQRAEL